MFDNTNYSVNIFCKENERLTISDNYSTFFTIIDFTKENRQSKKKDDEYSQYDGLWSFGFHIFKSFDIFKEEISNNFNFLNFLKIFEKEKIVCVKKEYDLFNIKYSVEKINKFLYDSFFKFSGAFYKYKKNISITTIQNNGFEKESIVNVPEYNMDIPWWLIFKEKYRLNITLLKNNNGFLIDFIKIYEKFTISFEIDNDFDFIKKDKNSFIFKYKNPLRDGYHIDNLFVSFSFSDGLEIVENGEIKHNKNDKENVNSGNEKTIFFKINLNNKKSKARQFLFINYSNNLYELEKKYNNINNIETLIKTHINNTLLPFRYNQFILQDKNINKALVHSISSSSSFVMNKTEKIGIWAGFPWFDNPWGRDSFISLPGIALVTGRYELASYIIDNFFRYQNQDEKDKNYGKIPNVVFNENKILYNTADATPLLIRELYEYYLYTNDINTIFKFIKKIELAIDNVYIKNKDENNLLPNDDADDWMDARIEGNESLSPRGDKQVEIQVLWFTALYCAYNIINDILEKQNIYLPFFRNFDIDINNLLIKRDLYKIEAEKMLISIKKFFTDKNEPYIFDHLNRDYSKDYKIRPNVLLAIYYNDLPGIPKIFPDDIAFKAFKLIVKNCVFEHGVSSLSKYDEDFHPYHKSSMYHKDAAYHNGAIWVWLSGPFIHCANKYFLKDFGFKHFKKLINEINSGENPGTLPELFEPVTYKSFGLFGKNIKFSGTFSQAWSIAEFTRVMYQEYFGIRFNVPERKLYLSPELNQELNNTNVSIRYGFNETLNINYNYKQGHYIVEVRAVEITSPLKVYINIKYTIKNNGENKYKKAYFKLLLPQKNATFKFEFTPDSNGIVKLNNLVLSNTTQIISTGIDDIYIKDNINDLKYCDDITSNEIKNYNSMKIENYLFNKIRKIDQK